MKDSKLKRLMKDNIGEQVLEFIPNRLGINLCSVDDIEIIRQTNGELKKITIRFIPNEIEEVDPAKNSFFAVPC